MEIIAASAIAEQAGKGLNVIFLSALQRVDPIVYVPKRSGALIFMFDLILLTSFYVFRHKCLKLKNNC